MRIDHQYTRRIITLVKQLANHKENIISEEYYSSERNSIYSDQLDQLTKNQDWKQDYYDLEQNSKYVMDS